MSKYYLTILLILSSSLALASCSFISDSVGSDAPSVAAINFTVSLAENRIGDLRDMSQTELYEKLENWTRSHDQYICKAPFWAVDDRKMEAYRNLSNKTENGKERVSFNTLYLCQMKDEVYILTVKDIVLEPLGSSWMIQGWGDVCEAYDYRSCIDSN